MSAYEEVTPPEMLAVGATTIPPVVGLVTETEGAASAFEAKNTMLRAAQQRVAPISRWLPDIGRVFKLTRRSRAVVVLAELSVDRSD